MEASFFMIDIVIVWIFRFKKERFGSAAEELAQRARLAKRG